VPAANIFRAAQATRLPLQKRAAIANRKSAIGTSLLPLDRARWFGRDIVNDAVNAFDFVHDAIGDAGE
jgi:hypothetical protein